MRRVSRAFGVTAALLLCASVAGASGSSGGHARTAEMQAGSSTALRAQAAQVRKPRGRYTSRKGNVLILAGGRGIDLAAFDFPCRATVGRTTLNAIPVRKTRGRWRFSIRMFGSATYEDDHPDENVRVRFLGRFSPSGRVVTGSFEVRSPHCGSTGLVRWTASR